MKKKRNKKRRIRWKMLILPAIFFLGLAVMLYPALSNYWNSFTATRAIVDYETMMENMEEADYTKAFAAAEAYNKKLSQLTYPLADYEKVEGYLETLDVSGTGMMGYITIETIGVELPVYHTTDENVLATAVGHLQGTSLPVGGTGTHSVVSAHRGLPTATLFTNLDHLEIGDTFYFTILDKTFTYQVDQIKTVKPNQTEDLAIDPEKDYCTLLTCTPYGINTERLLVRGHRIESVAKRTIHLTSDAHQIDPLIVTPIVGMVILVVLMIIVLVKPVKKDDLGDDF